MKNKLLLFTLLLTCFETTHAEGRISAMLGLLRDAVLPPMEDVAYYMPSIPGMTDVYNAAKNVAGRAQDAGGYLYNTAKNAMGYFYPNPNNADDAEANQGLNIYGQRLGPNDYPPDQHHPSFLNIDERGNQGANVHGQASAELPLLLNEIKGDKKYDVPTWRTLCTLLQSASEQEKKDAIENLRATSLVRDKYNNNIDEFLTAFEHELQDFNPLWPVDLYIKTQSPNIHDIIHFVKDYIERGFIQRPIIRQLVCQSYYMGAKSLDELVLSMIALGSFHVFPEDQVWNRNRYVITNIKENKNAYLASLAPQDRHAFEIKLESMVTAPESSKFMNLDDPENPFYGKGLNDAIYYSKFKNGKDKQRLEILL